MSEKASSPRNTLRSKEAVESIPKTGTSFDRKYKLTAHNSEGARITAANAPGMWNPLTSAAVQASEMRLPIIVDHTTNRYFFHPLSKAEDTKDKAYNGNNPAAISN